MDRSLSLSLSLARFLLDHRALVALALAVSTLVALLGIYDPIAGKPRLRIDPSLNEMLPADDPARLFYEELLMRFGSDDTAVIAIRGESLFTPDGLATLVRTTEALAVTPGVHHVDGLATALRMRRVDDDLDVGGYLESPVETQAEADALRADVLADPLRAGTFVSRDGSATAILVTFERLPEDEFLARGVDLEVLAVARETAPDFSVSMAGTPHVKAEVGRILSGELALMVPVVFLLMAGLSCTFFRSVRVGLVPLAAIALGLVWTVGIMGWVGHDLNIVTTLIPPLVLALGFAYSAHVVAGFVALDGPARERARRALAHVAFPVTFTALTTAAGFLSLTSSGLEVIRGFGIFAATSTFATLLASLTLVPILLGRNEDGSPEAETSTDGFETSEEPKRGASDWLDDLFGRVAAFDVRHANAILGAALLASGLAVFAATRIEVNLPVIENFGREAPIRLAYEEVDRLFGGANQFYVMLRAQEKAAFERPERLRAVADLQTWLEAQPEIGSTTSVVQYLEVLNEALGPEATPTRKIPESERLIAQLLLFGANEELDVLIDRAHQVITILVRSTATETREFDRLAARIDERTRRLPAGITAQTTGNAILLTRSADRIARGQATSLGWACALIGLLLVGYFRSLRLGGVALLPNLLPVLLYFGLLGATGTTLNNSTALMGSIVLGIAVDDTLHLIVEYRRGLASGRSPEESLSAALAHVGRAITVTTLAVCCGLLVVGASALRNQAEFGWLGAATLAIAWFVDVTVTPAICLRWLRASSR